MKERSFVYFVADDTKSCIRIGSSSTLKQRLATHRGYGLYPLAMLPGIKRYEDVLHKYFESHRMPNRDISTYAYDGVFPYVERLLQYKYATQDPEKAMTWSAVDFQLWKPENITEPLWDGQQRTLFVTEGLRADARDCYETPENIIEVCRAALGGTIDLDPCSTSMANERICAMHFYDEARNGLSLPWLGKIFLNPPYGGKKEPAAALFIRKLIVELDAGNTTDAVTVLNLQSWPTRWFPQVWKHAKAHAVWKSRIDFIRPRTESGSKPYASSKNGTIFSYFGSNPECFIKAFRFQASVFREWHQN